ncbi:hypothetical protein A7982_13461 [Minicystis rosea]|nr:hypothetical protein A7982_13461 [Minicystis rosea]
MPLHRALFALVAILALTSSCAAPLQNGGVEMRPGAEERLEMICRYRTAAGAASVCATPAESQE